MAIATLRDVFPHVVFYLGDRQGLMIASMVPLESDPGRLAELSRRDGVREMLALYGATDLRELFGRIRKDPELKDIKVIAISGYIREDEAPDLIDMGFNDYLSKPFSPESLMAKIRKVLGKPASS